MLVPEGKMWDQKQHYTVSGIYADKSPVESKNTKVENNSAYSYYETDKEGNLLKPVSKETLDILSSLFGDNLNNIIDATIGNVYFRNTGIGLHKDTTEPNNNVGVYGVVLGNSYDLQITTQETNNPKYGAGAGTEINLEMKQGTVYKFGLNDDKGNITGRFITHRPVGNINTEVKSSNIKLPELNLPEVKKARYKQTSTIIPATTIDQYGLSITYRSVIEKNNIPKGQIKSDYTKQEAVQPIQLSSSNIITGYPQVNPIVKANIDKMIDAALQLKAKGGLIGFPSKGFGQDMLKGGVNNTPIARQTFIYLSKRLLELEFINPGFEKTLQSVDPQQDKTAIELIQEKQPITNKDVLDGLMHCFS